ncbi:hypothetical protein L596_013483 [Steinernema carpocapsae]|uniref:Uncharacterized protein n=1 Tax=Steinernema carpocapsae TaxID=34508 RepID=A0A4U5P0C6_STECR|nr:hypothetical protein L596_013483 [Steinernema carpocapsae]
MVDFLREQPQCLMGLIETGLQRVRLRLLRIFVFLPFCPYLLLKMMAEENQYWQNKKTPKTHSGSRLLLIFGKAMWAHERKR